MTASRTRNLARLTVILCVAILIPILLFTPKSNSQSANEVKSRQEEIREQMKVISRHLGVTCLTCHDANNFKSDKLSAYKVSKNHMKLTQVLIDNGMDGTHGPKADCYMCHRGVLKPDYQEKPHPLTK